MTAQPELSERLAVYSAYAFSTGIVVLSLISMYNDTLVEPDSRALVLDMIFLLIGLFILYGARRLGRRLTFAAQAEQELSELMLRRLEPLVSELASTQVAIRELSDRVDAIGRRVSRLQLLQPPAGAAPQGEGISQGFLIRSMYLSLLTMGALLLLYLRLTPNSIYVILILILLWWYVITDEYGMFGDTAVYLFIILPILLLPAVSLVLLAYSTLQTLYIFLFVTLVLYVVGYYSLVTYYATGRVPFIEKPAPDNRMRNGGHAVPKKLFSPSKEPFLRGVARALRRKMKEFR